jgi:putative transposase
MRRRNASTPSSRSGFGLSAQPAIRVIGKVADAYTTRNANIDAGNYGPHGSAKRKAVAATPIGFRADGAQPFDARCLSWQIPEGVGGRQATVSIWTTAGRLKGIRVLGAARDLVLLRTSPIGETDLISRDGKWYLYATVQALDAPQSDPVNGFVGVDLGIVNIATSSDGQRAAGARLNRYRKRQLNLRKRLQAKKTASARRLLKKRRRKEARFAADVNHQVSKRIVAEAQRTGRGIAVERLTGIRARVRSPNSAGFWPTRLSRPGWCSSRSTRPTRRRPAARAAGWTNETAAPKQNLSVAGVASLGTPTTTQRSTLPPAVSNAGAKSCAHTQRPP